jgi:hypothetical protein
MQIFMQNRKNQISSCINQHLDFNSTLLPRSVPDKHISKARQIVFKTRVLGKCKAFCIVLESDANDEAIEQAIGRHFKTVQTFQSTDILFQNELRCCGRRARDRSKSSVMPYDREWDQILELGITVRGGMRSCCAPFLGGNKVTDIISEAEPNKPDSIHHAISSTHAGHSFCLQMT